MTANPLGKFMSAKGDFVPVELNQKAIFSIQVAFSWLVVVGKEGENFQLWITFFLNPSKQRRTRENLNLRQTFK